MSSEPLPRPVAASLGDVPTVTGPSVAASVGDAPTITAGGAHAATVASGQQLTPPGFVIEGELGRGGMGVVYLATQAGLNRQVALKMILGDARVDQKSIIRFLAEAEAVASVRHPNVVEVYQFGEHAGRPYMALEFCPGGSLADGLKDGAMEPRLAAETLAAVAAGVGAAHAEGIVHRDLKPHNVLVTADGSPKVTDFGLAKKLAGDSELTRTNAVMGTPAYMAPEQAQGGTKFVGPQADVWALGVMLYELLCGERPFQGGDTFALLAAVMKGTMAPLRKKVPGVPRDLELITLKCLEREPKDRYPTAADLAADLGNWLAEKPITARPAGTIETAAKWARRNPGVSGALTAAVLALIVGTAVSVWQAGAARTEAMRATTEAVRAHDAEGVAAQERDTARSEKVRADEARTAAEKQLARAEGLLYANSISSAPAAWDGGDAATAIRQLMSARWDLRKWEFAYLWTRFHRNQVTLAGHTSEVTAVAFTRDGTRIASGSHDTTVRIHDAVTGGTLLTRKAETGGGGSTRATSVLCVAFSPDGTRIAAGSRDTIHVWDATTGKVVLVLNDSKDGASGLVAGIAFSPDGTRLAAVVAGPPRVTVWDATTGKTLVSLKGHGNTVWGVAFSPDGTRIATASDDATARVWDAATGAVLLTLRGHAGGVTAVTYGPDGTRLATSGFDRTVRVWDAATGTETLTVTGHTAYVRAVAFSPDGTRIASGGDDQAVRVWDAATGDAQPAFRGHSGRVNAVAFSPDGTRIASGGADAAVKVWNATAGPELPALTGYQGQVYSVAFTRDSSRVLAAGGGDGKLKAWDVETGELRAGMEGQSNRVAVSPDGTRLVTPMWDGNVSIRDAATGKSLLELSGRLENVTAVAFSPDGSRVLAGGKTVGVWDAATGKQLWSDAHPFNVLAIAYHPDGDRVVSSDLAGSIVVWESGTGRQLAEMKGGAADALAVSPDGRLLAAGGQDKTVTVWDLTTRAKLFTLHGHNGRVAAVAFSQDGSRIASAGEDRTVKVWDVTTGRELLTLTGHTETVTAVAFSRDGRWLASGSWDGTVRLWDAQFVPGDHELTAHAATVYWLGKSDDGKRIYSRDNSGTAIVWDARTWQPLPGAEWPIPNARQQLPKQPGDGPVYVFADGERIVVRDTARYNAWRAEQGRRLAAWGQPNPTWHRARAADAEKAGDGFAAAFHLRAVAKFAPADKDIAIRLAALERLAPPPRPVTPK